MLKKRVRVHIEGRNYALITTEDTKYVQQIADEVIAHIRKTATGPTQLDTRDCAVLAALDFCDERKKADSRSQEVIAKADKIIQKNNELNKLCSEYKEKLTEAINENTALSKQVKALEKEKSAATDENSALADKVKSLEEKLAALEKEKSAAANENSALADKVKSLEAKVAALEKENSEIKKKPAQPAAKNAPADKKSAQIASKLENVKKTEEEKRNEKLLGYVPMRQYSLFEDDNKGSGNK